MNKPSTPTPTVGVKTRRIRGSIDPRTVQRRASRILSAIDQQDSELSILLCDDVLMRELNMTFRGLDQPTDVLSFPIANGTSPPDAPCLLGDVVVSIETAAEQAAKCGHTLLDEVTALVIHGILHLQGFDHRTPAERRAMNDRSLALEALFRTPLAPPARRA